jgi:predicted peptidase
VSEVVRAVVSDPADVQARAIADLIQRHARLTGVASDWAALIEGGCGLPAGFGLLTTGAGYGVPGSNEG